MSEGGSKNCAQVQPALLDMCMDLFATHVDPNTHVYYRASPFYRLDDVQCSGTDSGSLDCAAPSCVKTQCPSTTHKDCPEYFTSQVLPSGREKYGPRFFQVSWLGGECKDFSDLKRHVPKMFHGWKIGWDNGEKTGTIIHGADKLLPGCDGTLDGPHVISKVHRSALCNLALTSHPGHHGASKVCSIELGRACPQENRHASRYSFKCDGRGRL